MWNTEDVLKELKRKYNNKEYRTISNKVQQPYTVEIQNVHFIADKDYIARKPSEKYVDAELKWYDSMSLNINDIEGGAPDMWKACADKDGYINSNYGWCVYSEENGKQFDHCLQMLCDDTHTREAIMIYNRPSMQEDYKKNGMHDFMCCQNMQYFINERDDKSYIDCIVNFRSNDAVFGFNNDIAWARTVLARLVEAYNNKTGNNVYPGIIYWNAGSLHVYQRHFMYLEQ